MKRMLIAATALAVAATLTNCGGDDELESPGTNEPTSTPPATSASQSASPSPTVDREAWRSKFTDEQLREFDYALRTWERFGELMEPYRRESGDPDDVRRIFETYTYNPTGFTDSYIASYVEGGVRQLGPPTPVYVTGRKIEVNKKGSLVEFDQCTDYSTLKLERNGKPIKDASPATHNTAILRVQMGYDAGTQAREGGWRVLTSKVVDKPCE